MPSKSGQCENDNGFPCFSVYFFMKTNQFVRQDRLRTQTHESSQNTPQAKGGRGVRFMFIACRLRSKHLPTPVRMQLTAFYDKRISAQEETNMVVDEFAILQELQPAPISVDIVQVLYSDTISRVPIFKSMEEDVSHTLAEHTTTHTHTRTRREPHAFKHTRHEHAGAYRHTHAIRLNSRRKDAATRLLSFLVSFL